MKIRNVTPQERRAILALIRATTWNDKQIAAEVGRSPWTIFHIRTNAGIPAHRKQCVARVSAGGSPRATPTDIKAFWLSQDRRLSA